MKLPSLWKPQGLRTGAGSISEAHWKKQKPPKEYEDLSEARYWYLLETQFHNFLQKAKVMDCIKWS
jgi:hypothetical protein